jgi:hypothetical protein
MLWIRRQSNSLKLSHSVTIMSTSKLSVTGVGAIVDRGKQWLRLLHRLRVVNSQLSVFTEKPADQLDRLREGISSVLGLKANPRTPTHLSFKVHNQCVALSQEMVDAAFVNHNKETSMPAFSPKRMNA